jgi:hypothetical protein
MTMSLARSSLVVLLLAAIGALAATGLAIGTSIPAPIGDGWPVEVTYDLTIVDAYTGQRSSTTHVFKGSSTTSWRDEVVSADPKTWETNTDLNSGTIKTFDGGVETIASVDASSATEDVESYRRDPTRTLSPNAYFNFGVTELGRGEATMQDPNWVESGVERLSSDLSLAQSQVRGYITAETYVRKDCADGARANCTSAESEVITRALYDLRTGVPLVVVVEEGGFEVATMEVTQLQTTD